MPRLSIGAMAAVICCFAWGPRTYAGQGEPSAPGRLMPGGWFQPATPPQRPPVPETAPSAQPSAPEPVLARGLPKPAPDDNPIPIRPRESPFGGATARHHSIGRSRRHRREPARVPMERFNSDSRAHVGAQIAQLRVSEPSQAADSFAGVPTAHLYCRRCKTLGRFRLAFGVVWGCRVCVIVGACDVYGDHQSNNHPPAY
jgi:hypothetical protein